MSRPSAQRPPEIRPTHDDLTDWILVSSAALCAHLVVQVLYVVGPFWRFLSLSWS